MAKKFNYNKSVKEIQTIINEVEQDDIDVDELSTKIKRASLLIKKCKTQLKNTEEDVNSILEQDE